MSIFKPETDQELLKSIEDMENIAVKAQERLAAMFPALDVPGSEYMDKMLTQLIFRAQDAQEYVRKEKLNLHREQ